MGNCVRKFNALFTFTAPSAYNPFLLPGRTRRFSNMSASLMWECTKKYNRFLVKGGNRTKGAVGGNRDQFSCEPGNLANVHTFKHSGLVNSHTIDIRESKDGVVVTKTQLKSVKSEMVLKKDARRMLKAMGAGTKSFRPNLTTAALRKLSAVQKSIRAAKAKK